MPPPPLPLTGERTVPGVPEERYWFARHVAAYDLAARACAGRRVLDAGCGEGYGLRLLAEAGATSVAGVELDAAVVAHARAAYPEARVLQADVGAVPLPDASVDVVVTFQVVEHVWDIDGFLRECARLLRPGGELWCATPNRLTFTPGSDHPVNPFHHEELSPDELAARVRAVDGLELRTLLGLHHGPRLCAVEALARRPFPDLVLSRTPEAWPRWLRTVVAAVRPGDFRWRADRLATSLDVLAVATRR